MMRKICLPLFILFNLLVFTGCDNIPRNRPTIDLSENTTSVVEEETETEEVITIERPDLAIVIQPEHCSCLNGEPTSIGNCDAFCQERSAGDQVEKFYFDVELTAAITESNLGDVAGFCSTQDDEEITVSCSIEIKDEDGNIQSSAFDPADGQTSFEIEVATLSSDETFRISIVENISGARSTTVQLRKIADLIDDPRGGTLALMPVNQYSCLFRSGSFDSQTGDLIIEDVNRFHFYFIPETRPEPLLESSIPSVNCHDLELFGSTPISSPLLEEKTGIFTVWNRDDPRFFALNNDNGILLVHELIEQELLLQGQTVSSTPELFFELSWPNGFDDGDTNPSDDSTSTELNVSSGNLGYYMTPFSDPDTLRAYCPTREHFYSESPLFKAMRVVLDIDTEGLYAAKQDNVCDFLLIKESLLKQIWFYIEGGEHIEPTDSTVSGKKIQFYWPADPSSPFIKKSHQRTYTLKLSSEITCSSTTIDNGGAQDSSGVRTNIPPHDKRIGCIPVLQD